MSAPAYKKAWARLACSPPALYNPFRTLLHNPLESLTLHTGLTQRTSIMLVAIHHGALGLLSLVALAGIAQAAEIGGPCDRPKTAQACNNQNQVLLCKGSKWTFDQQCSGDEVCTGTIYQIDHFETLKTEAGKPAPATEEERAFCTKRNPGPPPSLPCDPNTM